MRLDTSDCNPRLLKQGATASQLWRRTSSAWSKGIFDGVHLPILPEFTEFSIKSGKVSIRSPRAGQCENRAPCRSTAAQARVAARLVEAPRCGGTLHI